MKTLNFRKMHGIGNDFVFIKLPDESLFDAIQKESIKICDRNFGVGADGVILLTPSQVADIKMTIINSDGSIAKMCGNAVRCIGRIMSEEKGNNEPVTIETLGGIKTVWIMDNETNVWQVKVDMGEPILKSADIPVRSENDAVIDKDFELDGLNFKFTCVSMGNPHAIAFVDKTNRDLMMKYGPLMEVHSAFPDRTNVEFVEVTDEGLLTYVWERGAGPTLACGTGACAVLVAANTTDRSGKKANVILPGGKLEIEWGSDNRVYMTGPAEHVFFGEITI